MPFTLSHPAAVLPLRRWCPRFLNFPALFVGSMLPDFGYFFRFFELSILLHSPLGSLLCIPLGLAVIAGWRYVQDPIAELLPSPHREFWKSQSREQGGSVDAGKFFGEELLTLSLSIFIGAWTHIILDSFTHSHGFFVDLWPQLFKYGFTVCGIEWQIFRCLQYGLSLVGLFFLSKVYRASLGTSDTPDPQRARKLTVLAVIPIIGFLLALALACFQHVQEGFSLARLGFLVIVYSVAFSFALLVVIALARSRNATMS